jgi:hypothetical protein
MISRKLVALALLILPGVATAQRTRGSFGRDAEPNWDELAKGSGGLQLSNRDVESISPLKLLIDKRKDLKLTDDQLGKIKDVESKLKEQNLVLFKALDSLRRETRPPAKTTDDDRARMMRARRDAMGVVKEIRGNYDASLKEALPLLDDTQRGTADGLLQKQSADAEKMLSEKMGSRGGDGGEGGRSGGRPPAI